MFVLLLTSWPLLHFLLLPLGAKKGCSYFKNSELLFLLLHLLLLPLGARKGCSYFKTKLIIIIFIQRKTLASSSIRAEVTRNELLF